jgi:Protein of unknown function (DUF2924)
MPKAGSALFNFGPRPYSLVHLGALALCVGFGSLDQPWRRHPTMTRGPPRAGLGPKSCGGIGPTSTNGAARPGSSETGKLLDRLARGEAEPVRHLKVGTVMMREHQGVLHEVMVVPDGFSWREKTYTSLSTIARSITGTSWNGPRFFGLRGNSDADVPSEADAAPDVPSLGSGQRTPTAPMPTRHGSNF